jgi:hypothetical protein
MDVNLNTNNYKFPDYYDWPSFFTIQRHTETRIKQLNMWSDLIRNFCKDRKVWRISKYQFLSNLSQNNKINR